MPTGYTVDVVDGKVTEFPDFAMTCARAFGALILMRDDPMDAEIPEKFEPSPHYASTLADAESRLSELRAMTPDAIRGAYEVAHVAAVSYWSESEAKAALARRRCEAMLAEVEAWKPPTTDHVEMKKFMRDQLTETIEFDGNHRSPRPSRQDPATWHQGEIRDTERRIEYYREAMEKDRQRAVERTEWVRKLRESLAAAVSE